MCNSYTQRATYKLKYKTDTTVHEHWTYPKTRWKSNTSVKPVIYMHLRLLLIHGNPLLKPSMQTISQHLLHQGRYTPEGVSFRFVWRKDVTKGEMTSPVTKEWIFVSRCTRRRQIRSETCFHVLFIYRDWSITFWLVFVRREEYRPRWLHPDLRGFIHVIDQKYLPVRLFKLSIDLDSLFGEQVQVECFSWHVEASTIEGM